MIKVTISVLAALCFSYTGIAQDLQEKIQFLQENTVSVTGKKKTFDQQFSGDPDHQFIVSVKITDTDNGEEIIKTVNLQDLNPSRVVFEPKRDMVEISARVKTDKKLVKIVENGEIQNYQNEFLFYAGGIEEARSLADALESIVELANKEAEKSDPAVTGKEQLLAYLSQSTAEVVINDESYLQEFKVDQENNNVITVGIEQVSKTLKEEYRFNAADLYISKIDFDTRRNQVLVSLSTKSDSKVIAYTKDGVIGNFTNGFEILMPSVEEARVYAANLKELVKLAESEESTGFENYSIPQCQEFLSQHIGQVIINQDTYSQSFTADPDNQLVFRIKSIDVSKGEEITYLVNAAYLHKGQTKFDTRGNAVLVTLEIDGNRKLISTLKGAEAGNYLHTFTVRAQDIESGRDLSKVFTRYKTLAREEMEQLNPFSDPGQAESFIVESVSEIVINTDTYLQSVKIDSENSCLYTYEFTDVSKDVQFDYEFNFQDIDLHKIQFDTRGSQAFVALEVRGGNKLIQTYKDGEMDKYVDELQILTKDIEQARMLVTALKLKAESCEK
ncbi:MAG: hypothetical protein DHS20C17_16410 [Cyclobacteriaceae bacterium]|nr:MAG: hypothetical protein DHS20C17_16410 [Cyclobacteriaceae bacterium]